MSSYTSVLDSYLLGGTGKYDSLLTRSRNRALSPVRATTPNPYTSTYTSSYGRNNYDSTLNKFYNQIDQLSSYYTPSSSRSYDPPSYRSNRQTSDYSSSSYSSTLRPSSYRRYLSNETSDSSSDSYSSRTSTLTSLITDSPSYDKFGRQLSNYERWKLRGADSSDGNRSSVVLPAIDSARERGLDKEPSPVYGSRFLSRRISTDSTPSYKSKNVAYFPADVRDKLSGYDVRDVIGDGGCYYRCLSCYFTGNEESYNKYRREVMSYLRENLDNYSTMIKSEVGYASTNDYFARKTRADRQEFAETTEIIATSCLYDINIHVLALVPGKRTWEWLHFDPSIGTGKQSHTNKHIYLYNAGSIHFMLCTPK